MPRRKLPTNPESQDPHATAAPADPEEMPHPTQELHAFLTLGEGAKQASSLPPSLSPPPIFLMCSCKSDKRTGNVSKRQSCEQPTVGISFRGVTHFAYVLVEGLLASLGGLGLSSPVALAPGRSPGLPEAQQAGARLSTS